MLIWLTCRGTPGTLLAFPTRRSSDLRSAGVRPSRPCLGCGGVDVDAVARGIDDELRAAGGVERAEREKAYLKSELTHRGDRKSTRLNSSHLVSSYAVFCLKTKPHGQT